jgi:peptidoglycan hydrolase CwlO-like protein
LTNHLVSLVQAQLKIENVGCKQKIEQLEAVAETQAVELKQLNEMVAKQTEKMGQADSNSQAEVTKAEAEATKTKAEASEAKAEAEEAKAEAKEAKAEARKAKEESRSSVTTITYNQTFNTGRSI